MTWWAVTWTRYGQRNLIDVDSMELAAAIAVQLGKQAGVVDIAVIEREDDPLPPEVKELIRRRWEERIKEREFHALREAIG